MLQRHDWVTLYTDGFRYLEKAPLMYWILAASYQVFGISN
jgi:4-amino-4-deoxy-L-arabinose transferase-like glycosyltransferase